MIQSTTQENDRKMNKDFENWWLSLPNDIKQMYASDGLVASERAFLEGRRTAWQPIETVPEGVFLVFYDANATEVVQCMFVDWVVDGKFVKNPKRTATHWMNATSLL